MPGRQLHFATKSFTLEIAVHVAAMRERGNRFDCCALQSLAFGSLRMKRFDSQPASRAADACKATAKGAAGPVA